MRRTAAFGTASSLFLNLRGPHYQDWDTALEKNWTFKESMRAQFRFETFNSFNHPNFYAPGPHILRMRSQCRFRMRQQFREITSAFPGRVVQWAGKFYW
jgi:hypothetical protein